MRIDGLPLVLIGASLVLVPVVAHGITSERDKARIGHFYERNPNGATLPHELARSDYAGYDWACFTVGATLAFTGLRRPKSPEPTKARSEFDREV